MKVLVTGADGFVGFQLCRFLALRNINVVPAVRTASSTEHVMIGDVGPNTVWGGALRDVTVVVHLAARVHVMKENVTDSLAEFRRINVAGTLRLARQAADANVKRFVYLSTIKVNGEITRANTAFRADDIPSPSDPYAVSKYEAEQGLLDLAKNTDMDVVIIRPPLVYGPDVKANFLSMMRWIYKGVPLPFGAIHNKRSLVGLDNLLDLIMTCLEHPAAANQIFLASDGDDMSTTDLLRRTAAAFGKSSWLVPVPQSLLEFGLKVLGNSELGQRLCGSLQIDISKTRELLGWSPPMSVDEGLHKTAKAFLRTLQR